MNANSVPRSIGALLSCGAIVVGGHAFADHHGEKAIGHSVDGIGELQRANETIGMDITNLEGESLGSVEDIILDYDQRRIAYAIVSYGGILGLGDKHFAVPWQAFGHGTENLTLQIAKEKLENAPGFEAGELPNHADPLFHKGVHTFYGVSPYDLDRRDKAPATEPAPEENSTTEQEAETSNYDAPDAPLLSPPVAAGSEYDWDAWTTREGNDDWARRLSKLTGMAVHNAAGEQIAEVEDIVIDSKESRAVYALVAYGETLGLFGETAVVPWSALTLDKNEETYTLSATLEDLKRAKVDVEKLYQLKDENFSRTVHETFNVVPYWRADVASPGASAAAREARLENDSLPASPRVE